MRTDIGMDIDAGDIDMRKRVPAYSATLKWTAEDDFFVYGDCELKSPVRLNNLISGIGLYVEQRDSIKPIKINFFIENGDGTISKTGYLPARTITGNQITPAKLVLIADNLFFRVYLPSDGYEFTVASGHIADLKIDASMDQNEYYVLIANASSYYEHPLTGVNVRSYLNSDIIRSNLAEKIQSELQIDNVTVSKIQYDELTQEILIDSIENT